MFASKDDFKEQYLAEFTKTMAKPFEECTKPGKDTKYWQNDLQPSSKASH